MADFKDDICESLVKYNDDIKKFKKDMTQYSKNAEFIKKEISDLRNRYMVIPHDKSCDNCSKNIYDSAFYLFPCTHAFHKKCAREILRKRGEDKLIQELDRLDRDIGKWFEGKNIKPDDKNRIIASGKIDPVEAKSLYEGKGISEMDYKILQGHHKDYDEL